VRDRRIVIVFALLILGAPLAAQLAFVDDADFPVAGSARLIAGGDLDADGDLDLVVCSVDVVTNAGSAQVWLNDGAAHLTQGESFTVLSGVASASLVDLSADDRLDLLLTHRIQPEFPAGRITVVYEYPASQCALAKIRADDPPVAERFELYVGQHELANGYHELTDAAEQRARFESDNARRRSRGLAELPLDENLLKALGSLPDCAGVALGIERLLMAMTGSEDIRAMLAFPFGVA